MEEPNGEKLHFDRTAYRDLDHEWAQVYGDGDFETMIAGFGDPGV